MRIIDKNTDFYDYLQYAYPDDAVTFDRRDSFILTKEEFMSHFYIRGFIRGCSGEYVSNDNLILLQICNTYWLFLLTITNSDNCGKCLDYDIKLLRTWKNYNRNRQMLCLSHIMIDYVQFYLRTNYFGCGNWKNHQWDKADDDGKKIDDLVDAINNGDYRIKRSFNNHTLYKGCGVGKGTKTQERHIPILREIGVAGKVNDEDVYFALDEYFSKEKEDSEHRESVDLTNNDKIKNHGFDLKHSFRGKPNK